MSLTIPMLVAYSFISNLVGKIGRYTDNWMSSVVEYLSGITNEWYLLDTGLVPAIPAPVYRKSDISHISWVYNMSYNVLAAPHSTESSVRLPFLSASLISNNRVYPMDDFLEEFRVIHDNENGKILTPREIVLCWEIYNKTWLDSATLTVIDMDGNDHTVDGFGRGTQEWTELLYELEDEEDTEEEEEEEKEEEEEEEEQEEEGEQGEQEEEEEQEEQEEQEADNEASSQELELEQPAAEEQMLPVLEQEAPLIASITLHNSEIVPEELVVNA